MTFAKLFQILAQNASIILLFVVFHNMKFVRCFIQHDNAASLPQCTVAR